MMRLLPGLPAAVVFCLLPNALPAAEEVSGVPISVDKRYQGIYRPQFHFTAKKNWINDPNGLVYYKGEYHLFFQHNPKGWSVNLSNMTWGHAVSPDMVHWTQLEHAIRPYGGRGIWSGSAVVDWNNTAGFQTGDEKVIVCIYTWGGGRECLAYSNDRGRTWTKYEKNPVLRAGDNRDSKVFWHEPTKQWVMALYLGHDGDKYALFSSPNLKEWTRLHDIRVPNSRECPDMFELPVDGNPNNRKWVFLTGNLNYLLGTFDGKTFTRESGPHRANQGPVAYCYSSQTWSDIPASDGRRLQIVWMSEGKYPGMPFTQQMGFPCELTLRTTPEGIRLYRKPVKEIENIHAKKHSWADVVLKPGENLLSGISGELFDIRAEIEILNVRGNTEFGFILRGKKIQYDVDDRMLSCLGRNAPLSPENNRIRLQILLDRTSLEVFGNDGLVSMPMYFLPDPANRNLSVYAIGGVRIVSLDVYELRSAWPAPDAKGGEK